MTYGVDSGLSPASWAETGPTVENGGLSPRTVTLTVTLTVDGDEQEMGRTLVQYLTQSDMPFIGDFGPDAWGGYEGPFVVGVEAKTEFGYRQEWSA